MVHKNCHKLFRKACTGQIEGGGMTDQSTQEGSPKRGHNGNVEVPGSDYRSSRQASSTPRSLRKTNRQNVPDDLAVAVLNEDDKDEAKSESGSGGAVASGGGPHQYSLKDFELLRVIGRGSYAKVLMVELKATKRIYAMKVIKKELVNDDEDIDWVQTEKHVFETASNYPFLVGLHSCFQTKSRLVL